MKTLISGILLFLSLSTISGISIIDDVFAIVDSDGDGVTDDIDNCTLIPNPSQCDGNRDGYGNRCDADFNNDGIVGRPDIGPLLYTLGTTNAITDLTCDGIVNRVDIGLFRYLYGKPPGPSPRAALPPPADLVVSIDDAKLTITWSPVTEADSYNLYYASEPEVTKANYASLINGEAVIGISSPHSITGLVNGTTYYLVITAVSLSGESVESTEISAAPIQSPQGFAAVAGDKQVTLNWNLVIGATSYNIYQANEFGVTKNNYTELDGGVQTINVTPPYTVNNLDNGASYSFVVTASGSFGEGPDSLEITSVPGNYSAWSWQNPKPQGNHLNAVEFFDTATGWAVGSGGAIVHTNNAGLTWNKQTANTIFHLNDISVISTTEAWAVGSDGNYNGTGILLRTSDGGNTWETQASPSGMQIYGVEFTDASNGWIVGYDGLIYTTADGGSKWTPQNSGVTTALWKVDFIDNNTGWAVGGQGGITGVVLSTTDGGLNWDVKSLGSQLSDVDFVNSDYGWISDADWNSKIYATVNGGGTWGTQSVPLTTSESLSSIAFANAATGWSVAWRGKILNTENGGGNWIAQNSGVDNWLRGVDASGLAQVWTVGDRGIILNTLDGGAIWKIQSQNVSPELNSFSKITFLDSLNGWALNRGVLKTSDGGVNWTAQPIITANLGSPSDISFVDKDTGWVVSGIIQRTVDGGASWTAQDIDLTGIRGVSFVDANNGWVVGDIGLTSGLIRSTVDGGLNWQVQNSGTSSLLYDIEFVDTQNGWSVGADGVIRHTADGGTSWHGQISGTTTVTLRQIKALDALTAWAVGGNTIVSTTDGGATWIPQVLDIDGLYGVHFVDANNGWVISSHGEVLATQDGGISWEKLITPLYNTFAGTDVHFIDSATGWIVGGHGILKTTSGGR